MPVPDYQALMRPVLKALAGGAETPLSEVRTRIAAAEGLTAEEMREMLCRVASSRAAGMALTTSRRDVFEVDRGEQDADSVA